MITENDSDIFFMKEALKQAYLALEKNEVPIGAVIAMNGKIIARAHNLTEQLTDTTAHAEMQAITSATSNMGAKYLQNSTLYVTLEPCVMCMGAIFWSKLTRIVYGASDLKQGFSKYQNILQQNNLSFVHPKAIIKGGILDAECAGLLTAFFKNKR